MHEKFEITCPNCGTKYIVKPGGVSLYCFDYITDDGQSIYGVISTGEMECPKCNKNSKEEEWNFTPKEN